jgi:aryl-alcohol dehydrogenase-like predicted oxidoreductase
MESMPDFNVPARTDDSPPRLGVPRIDLYQFYWPDETGTPMEDCWNEMVRLIRAGKVRWGGVSNFDVSLLERCEAVRHVDSLQPPFSLIKRRAAASATPSRHDPLGPESH